jgi:hypothetical protein
MEAEIHLKGNHSDHVQDPWLQAGLTLKKEACLLIRNIKKKGILRDDTFLKDTPRKTLDIMAEELIEFTGVDI